MSELDKTVSEYNVNLLAVIKMASDHFAGDPVIKEQILRARDRLIVAKGISYTAIVDLSCRIVIKYREMIMSRDLSGFTEEMLNAEIAAVGKKDKTAVIFKFFGFAKKLYDEIGDDERNELFNKLNILLENAIRYMLLSRQ